jgi:hypothetical protein
MNRVGAILAAAALAAPAGGCGFAVKHPAATAAIVGGTLALSTCELASSDHSSCLLASGGAAALLGLVAAGALWLGETGEDSVLQPPPDPAPPPRHPAQPRAAANPAMGQAPATPALPAAPAAPAELPAYLREPPQLFARSGDAIAPAPAGDQAVAATYARSPVRGPLRDGARLTILTAKAQYKLGEEVRVIHVLEAPEPGGKLYVMGPKPIHGEYVDGVDRTGPAPGADAYDGRVLDSPGVDFNHEVTSYTFTTPGPHRIQWRAGGRESNVLEITVVP